MNRKRFKRFKREIQWTKHRLKRAEMFHNAHCLQHIFASWRQTFKHFQAARYRVAYLPAYLNVCRFDVSTILHMTICLFQNYQLQSNMKLNSQIIKWITWNICVIISHNNKSFTLHNLALISSFPLKFVIKVWLVLMIIVNGNSVIILGIDDNNY